MPKPFFSNNHNKIIQEIIRVNHAGEFGAQKIYQGQINYTKNIEDQKILKHMLDQEQEHLEYFSKKVQKGLSRPTFLMPIWSIGGYLIGAISAKISMKLAMIVTENVETVIEEHYSDQIKYLKNQKTESSMLKKIEKFKIDEIDHKNIANIAIKNNNSFGSFLGHCIKIICRSAIFLSKKI
jgi:ubiquinone biosynthesis monooxygenase Coq7